MFFFNHNLNFPNLMKVNMQRWMPMQRWRPGRVMCWMSGDGSRLAELQTWRKWGVAGWRGLHIGLFRSHFKLNFF